MPAPLRLKLWMSIHYDMIQDRQNKTAHSHYYSQKCVNWHFKCDSKKYWTSVHSCHFHNNTPLKKKCFSTGRFVLPWLFTTLRVMAIAYKCDMRCIMETQRVNVWVSAHQTFDHTVYLLNVAWFSMSTTEQKTQNPIVFWLKHVHLIWDNIWILRMSVAVVNV